MDLTLQPKPNVKIPPADKGIVSWREYFVKKEIEEIKQYFFPGHLIRNWKPKAELLYSPTSDETAIQYECDFNRDVQNCFVEDYAEEVFLRAPPPCFVVIGKFGTSVRKLSQEIAKEYGSVLIQVDDIVNQVIKTQTETAKLLERILRLGVSLTLNFILALVSYLAHTAEARHRGYVLCGLPSTPHLYDLSVEQQFNYLFTWDNKPTVFVHVLFEDEDLVNERTDTRCEIENVKNEKCISPHTNYNDTALDVDEKEETDELLPIKEFPPEYERDINISPSRPWVQLPRDEESQVWSELELFDVKIKPLIELIISRVDPQYFITVDSRGNNEFEVVKARLKLLQIWKSPLAFPFIPIKESKPGPGGEETGEGDSDIDEEEVEEEIEEDEEIIRAAEEPPETAFLTLFYKKTISPKYRWELSHYNYICPVSLRAGQIVKGKSEFAVCFLKYIYFLKDKESVVKFLKNPRSYVLPIRPKPLCRFIILGLPFTGKTSLAKCLAAEFSISVIDVNTVLKEDLERKKNVYREFCRQKAESREITRLTAQAWKDWRMEEDQRVNLIEKWILYIQTLLERRIKQFYTLSEPEGFSFKETQIQSYSPDESSEHSQIGEDGEGGNKEKSVEEMQKKPLEVRGVSIGGSADPYEREYTPADNNSTPSARITHALKHDDFNFNENGLEVEANLFFSSLWNTFANEIQGQDSFGKPQKNEEYGEDQSAVGEDSEDSVTVNWCSLLPPQSLSSFLMKKKPITVREKRKSFNIFLEAASNAYWAPSLLKKEFVKWRLPCFMDIPLCEIYLDNPVLLFKYIPEWLRERPLIPEPIDSTHPSVIDAGDRAYARASVVTVKQNTEEMGTLLVNAIEKAEREGMRVTGEVISPGGWVVDNMILDQEVWEMMVKRNVFPDHVYFLMDSEPEFLRIINHWCEMNILQSSTDKSFSLGKSSDENDILDLDSENSEQMPYFSLNAHMEDEDSLKKILVGLMQYFDEGDREMDEIYNRIINYDKGGAYYTPPFSVDLFCHNFLQNTVKTWCDLRDQGSKEDIVVTSSHNFSSRHTGRFTQNIPLGTQLMIVGNNVLNVFEEQKKRESEVKPRKAKDREAIKFFIFLLTLPGRLERIKEWISNLSRDIDVKEIDIFGKTREKVFLEIREELYEPFIKKPRELESFEVEEINEEFLREAAGETEDKEEEELEGEDGTLEVDREDLRIYGESGPLCVVNLERNILLFGKREFALRYYGKLYFFYNEDAKKKFIEDPEKYAPYYSPIRCLPPMRIFLVGPIGCGKTSLSLLLSNQCSLKYEDYIAFLNHRLIPYLQPPVEKLISFSNQKLLLSDDHSKEARAAIAQFTSAPYSKREFWLENPFYSGEESKKIFENLISSSKNPLTSEVPEFSYKSIESALVEDPQDLNLLPNNSPDESFLSMKELESVLKEYLQGSTDLPDFCIERSLKFLWTREPHVSKGVFLDGFPLRAFDMKHMTDNNWFPDLILEITLPEEEVINRNIEELMKSWDTKLKQEIIEEKLLEETVVAIYRTQMLNEKIDMINSRREALKHLAVDKNLKDLSESQLGKETVSTSKKSTSRVSIELVPRSALDRSFELPDEIEVKIQNEVNEIIEAKFPRLHFNPNFETYDSGRARIIGDLTENYRRDMTEIEKIKGFAKEIGIPWHELDGLKSVKDNYTEAMMLLNVVKNRINCKGEFAFGVSTEMAETLLQQGYYFLSKFGRWCPVQVYQMKNSIHMYRPLMKRGKIFPVVYRNYIYFIAGKNERQKFIDNPIKYTFNEPHHPNIPLRIAVIGPPKSGKTTLSKRLGLMFDLKVITMGSALRFVVENMPKTTLSESIDSYLRRGCFLPLSLKVEALMACLSDPVCATQGFVFDGIPFDAALTQSLAEKGKLPFVIISLVADSYYGKCKRQDLDVTEFRLPYKNRVNMDSRYQEWDETYRRFFQWNQDTYNNIYEVNAKSTIVDIFYQAYDIIRKSFFAILYYVEYCVSERALPLQYLCVSQHEYELRKSPFHNSCPVCWLESNKLSSSSDPPERSGLVQYLNHFYWICPDHMDEFIKHPKRYLPPNSPEFPEHLPKVLNRSMFETASMQLKIHGRGRCPVTRTDFPSSLNWEGSWDFACFYIDEVFLCKSKKMLERFLARPWRYYDADTEFEVDRIKKSEAVEELGPPKVTSLPPIGFLEQTVADLIQQGLRIVGAVRPVYPDMTPYCTGCIFLGLYLKVYNKRNARPHLDKHYLDFMLCYCRAYRFKVPPFAVKQSEHSIETKQEESSDSDDSDTTNNEQIPVNTSKSPRPSLEGDDVSSDSCWLDFECQADKKMWSAKFVSPNFVKMFFTSNDELIEIPEPPKKNVILRYQTYGLRPYPIPPVNDCVTFIYSAKPTMTLPGKFNCDSLYQSEPLFSTPYLEAMPFNPEKEFGIYLFQENQAEFPSESNLWKGKRALSKSSSEESDRNPIRNMDSELQYLIDNFVPRFQLFDRISSVNTPPVPCAIEEDSIVYNPHRDYTYMLLLADFFHSTHVLKCFEWGEAQRFLEYSDRYNKNLALTSIQIEYLHKPRKTASIFSRRSILSYQETFDAATNFMVVDEVDEETSVDEPHSRSVINFVESLILEKLNEVFIRLSHSDLSYDFYELHLTSTGEIEQEPVSVLIREVLPYPPLQWDIISRPYYSYNSISPLFSVPHLDHIAHERHVSLLDGIMEPYDNFRFVRSPTWVRSIEDHVEDPIKHLVARKASKKVTTGEKKFYFVYEFFDFQWTSFLTYPFSWAYNQDVSDHFVN